MRALSPELCSPGSVSVLALSLLMPNGVLQIRTCFAGIERGSSTGWGAGSLFFGASIGDLVTVNGFLGNGTHPRGFPGTGSNLRSGRLPLAACGPRQAVGLVQELVRCCAAAPALSCCVVRHLCVAGQTTTANTNLPLRRLHPGQVRRLDASASHPGGQAASRRLRVCAADIHLLILEKRHPLRLRQANHRRVAHFPQPPASTDSTWPFIAPGHTKTWSCFLLILTSFGCRTCGHVCKVLARPTT